MKQGILSVSLSLSVVGLVLGVEEASRGRTPYMGKPKVELEDRTLWGSCSRLSDEKKTG